MGPFQPGIFYGPMSSVPSMANPVAAQCPGLAGALRTLGRWEVSLSMAGLEGPLQPKASQPGVQCRLCIPVPPLGNLIPSLGNPVQFLCLPEPLLGNQSHTGQLSVLPGAPGPARASLGG